MLVPALRTDGGALGLSREQVEELSDGIKIFRNKRDVGDRFWHMKAYWARQGERIRTAVGSCNFTHAGLSGSDGNVEAMLVLDGEPESLPEGAEIEDDDFAEETEAEEGKPEAAPVAIVVAWDWRASAWRWWLKRARASAASSCAFPVSLHFGSSRVSGKS